jgi:hypothetical protein
VHRPQQPALQEFNHSRLLFPELSVILTCHVVLASFSCLKSFFANLPMMVLWKIVTEVTEITSSRFKLRLFLRSPYQYAGQAMLGPPISVGLRVS